MAIRSAIASGLGDVGHASTPIIFNINGTWYLISGNTDGTFIGFNWTGTTWRSDLAIESGLSGVGASSAPTVFNMGGTWYLISGRNDGAFKGVRYVPVVVPPAPTSTNVTPDPVILNVTESQQFNATILPESANQSVTWSVTNITGNGTINATGFFKQFHQELSM